MRRWIRFYLPNILVWTGVSSLVLGVGLFIWVLMQPERLQYLYDTLVTVSMLFTFGGVACCIGGIIVELWRDRPYKGNKK